MTEPTAPARPVADLGRTHARFGLVAAAAEAYLDAVGTEPAPRRAALAVAGPVRGERIRSASRAWSFGVPDLGRELGLERLDLFDLAPFSERFVAKGRMRDYLLPVPVRLIVHPQAAPIGAARFLDGSQ